MSVSSRPLSSQQHSVQLASSGRIDKAIVEGRRIVEVMLELLQERLPGLQRCGCRIQPYDFDQQAELLWIQSTEARLQPF
jgi:hypothetical protein